MDKVLEKLEWQTIANMISDFAYTKKGKFLCENILPENDKSIIEKELNLTDEARVLLSELKTPPITSLEKIDEIIENSKVSRTMKEFELLEAANSLKISRLTHSFFAKLEEQTPLLFELSRNLYSNKELEEEIFEKFNEKGEIKDDATKELKNLRASYKDNLANLKKILGTTLSSLSKYLQEPVYTLRSDRYVFPVKVEEKNHVQGIVHDVSASGSTLFIEPKNIVELNNKIIELEIAIEHEINRILSELTNKILMYETLIISSYNCVGKIDFEFAKAKYALKINASKPTINSDKYINLKGFFHPILINVIDEVIKNDIVLGKDFDCLIVTGSNTGGKTVVLKTVALAVLMAKAGLFIPAYEGDIYAFENIFIDIGDEQSITSSLSTFSGHIKNIINIVEKSNDSSLILLDEIGAGTDPQEGSALAQSILENMLDKGAKLIVTTHYGELKSLAYTDKRFQNASVQFSVETLKPTYKLIIGIPGKSNAITIAQNLGLDENIVSHANDIYLTQKDKSNIVLEGLQEAQRELDKNIDIAKEKRQEIENLEQDYKEKIEKARLQRKKTVDIYKKKYDTQLGQVKEEIKKILEEIRRTKSEKVARRAFFRLSEIENGAAEEFRNDLDEIAPEYKKVDWESVKTGDTLFLRSLNQLVTLQEIPQKKKYVIVKVGTVPMQVKREDLFLTEKVIKNENNFKNKKGFEFSKKRVETTLDIRGERVLEGLDILDKYLDEANLSNVPQVTIIHGAGTGALRKAVREYLKDSPYVKSFRSGKEFEGADGVSIVELK